MHGYHGYIVAAVALVLAPLAVGGAHAAGRNEAVWTAAQANRAGVLDLLKQVVNVDSGTGDAAGGEKVAAIVAARLKALGAEVSRPKTEAPGLPDNLLAVFRGTGKGRILVIAHFDTVFGPGTVAQRPFRIAGARAHGPGVGDEKGGLVNAVTALKILRDLKFRDYARITFLLDNSEERGSPGAKQLILSQAKQHDVAFNMEPADPPDALTVWRKGSISIRLQVKGRAAHAGMAPQDGRNAATELLHQLAALDGAFPKSGSGTTVNLTILKAGTRNNIIPDFAEAVLNVRYRKPEDLEAVLAKIRAGLKKTIVPDTVAMLAPLDVTYPPLTENARIDALAGRANAIYAEIGRHATLSGNGGASESALAMSVGTVALDGLGYVGGDFHTDKEWIDLESVVPRLYLFTRLLMDAGANPPPKGQ